MFNNKQKQPASPGDAALQFQTSLDAIIATAQLAHVRAHQLGDLLEQRAQDLRVRYAITAPLR